MKYLHASEVNFLEAIDYQLLFKIYAKNFYQNIFSHNEFSPKRVNRFPSRIFNDKNHHPNKIKMCKEERRGENWKWLSGHHGQRSSVHWSVEWVRVSNNTPDSADRNSNVAMPTSPISCNSWSFIGGVPHRLNSMYSDNCGFGYIPFTNCLYPNRAVE